MENENIWRKAVSTPVKDNSTRNFYAVVFIVLFAVVQIAITFGHIVGSFSTRI